MLTYLIWGFDYLDGFYDRVETNLLPATLPPIVYYEAVKQKSEARSFDWSDAGFPIFLVLSLLLASEDRYNLNLLGIVLVLIMTSAPWLFIFSILVRAKRMLAIGMVPSAINLTTYWVVSGLSEGLDRQYSLIPLPASRLCSPRGLFS